jgi:hypothetical protein
MEIMKENSTDDSEKGFIPCYPSSSLKGVNTIYIDDVTVYKNYKKTNEFLKKLKKESNDKLLCMPEIKVIENELIVGILTETNQFVQLKEPEQDLFGDDLIKLRENNFINSDSDIYKNKGLKDKKRVMMVRKIRLESRFYNIFRNTIRILLNKYENFGIKKQVESIILSKKMLYFDKSDKIIEILKKMTVDNIRFDDKNIETILKNDSVSSCLNNIDDCESKNNCSITNIDNKNVCTLIIPKNNLVHDYDNNKVYFYRMADELIRYNNVQSFMLKPNRFLTFSKIKYSVNEDELIIIESLLNDSFFENLIPSEKNKYITYNSYDNVEPIQSVNYSNQFDYDKNMKIVDDVMDEKLLDKKIEIAKINKVRNLKLQAMRDCIVKKKVGVLGKCRLYIYDNTINAYLYL